MQQTGESFDFYLDII